MRTKLFDHFCKSVMEILSAYTGKTQLNYKEKYGEYDSLIAGSTGGTVNGNVNVSVNGGTFGSATLGALEDAAINGNVIL